jgi:hypothetical protein
MPLLIDGLASTGAIVLLYSLPSDTSKAKVRSQTGLVVPPQDFAKLSQYLAS